MKKLLHHQTVEILTDGASLCAGNLLVVKVKYLRLSRVVAGVMSI